MAKILESFLFLLHDFLKYLRNNDASKLMSCRTVFLWNSIDIFTNKALPYELSLTSELPYEYQPTEVISA